MNYLFRTPCNLLTDFDSNASDTGDTLAVTTGGYLHNCLTYTLASTGTGATYVAKAVTSGGRIQMWIKVDSAAVISTATDHNFLHTNYNNAGTTTGFLDVRLIGVTGGYTLRIVDETNSYATTVGTTVLALGQWYKIVLDISSGTIAYVYIGNKDSAEISYTLTVAMQNIPFNEIEIGKWYSSSYSGKFYVDEVLFLAYMGTAPTTNITKNSDCFQGWLQRYLSFDGAIIRPGGINGSGGTSEGNGTTNGDDIVSEGVSYALIHSVQNNDQTTFNLVETWIEGNLERINNVSLTTGLHLMAWHYDNEGFAVLDWNCATDADSDRVIALLWAHALWGSSGAINYHAKVLLIAADFKSYLFNSFGGKQYLCGDMTQLGVNPFEQATSYFMIPAFRLLNQYTGDEFWNQAIEGCYDVYNQTTSTTGNLATADGLHPDWNFFNSTTGVVEVDTNSGRTTGYGYNAFRTSLRIYLDYYFYNDVRGIGLNVPNMYTFLNTYYGANTDTLATTYNHDGTLNGTAYEKGSFYACNMWTFFSNSLTNANGESIYTNKVIAAYRHHAGGSYWADTASYFAPSYFGNIWSQWGVLLKEGGFTNYGAFKYTDSKSFWIGDN